ncbi:MAG TPA: DUF2752 domain-containing protein [Blastocatellia bacterium]|nr:DUF2752 domain-containing protein [Blastocatellia bacterium]
MPTDEPITEPPTLPANAADAGASQDDEPSRGLAWFAFVMLAGVFVVSLIHHPAEGNYFTICGFKNATGLPCPGCGLTHSFCAMGKGQLLAAFAWNLLGPPLFLLFALIWVRAACVLLKRRGFPRAFDAFAERTRLVRRFVIAFAVFGVARIAYILIADPGSIQHTALSELWSRLFS